MTDKLIKAFEYGVDYGLLLAEQERDSEDVLKKYYRGKQINNER